MNVIRLRGMAATMREVAERGSGFDIRLWNMSFIDTGSFKETMDAMHTCGSSACVAGWTAVSPMFREAGGTSSDRTGSPVYGNQDGCDAIRDYLECDDDTARHICGVYGERCVGHGVCGGPQYKDRFYGTNLSTLTAAQAAKRLDELADEYEREEVLP